jgi:hypothetical protein
LVLFHQPFHQLPGPDMYCKPYAYATISKLKYLLNSRYRIQFSPFKDGFTLLADVDMDGKLQKKSLAGRFTTFVPLV